MALLIGGLPLFLFLVLVSIGILAVGTIIYAISTSDEINEKEMNSFKVIEKVKANGQTIDDIKKAIQDTFTGEGNPLKEQAEKTAEEFEKIKETLAKIQTKDDLAKNNDTLQKQLDAISKEIGNIQFPDNDKLAKENREMKDMIRDLQIQNDINLAKANGSDAPESLTKEIETIKKKLAPYKKEELDDYEKEEKERLEGRLGKLEKMAEEITKAKQKNEEIKQKQQELENATQELLKNNNEDNQKKYSEIKKRLSVLLEENNHANIAPNYDELLGKIKEMLDKNQSNVPNYEEVNNKISETAKNLQEAQEKFNETLNNFNQTMDNNPDFQNSLKKINESIVELKNIVQGSEKDNEREGQNNNTGLLQKIDDLSNALNAMGNNNSPAKDYEGQLNEIKTTLDKITQSLQITEEEEEGEEEGEKQPSYKSALIDKLNKLQQDISLLGERQKWNNQALIQSIDYYRSIEENIKKNQAKEKQQEQDIKNNQNHAQELLGKLDFTGEAQGKTEEQLLCEMYNLVFEGALYSDIEECYNWRKIKFITYMKALRGHFSDIDEMEGALKKAINYQESEGKKLTVIKEILNFIKSDHVFFKENNQIQSQDNNDLIDEIKSLQDDEIKEINNLNRNNDSCINEVEKIQEKFRLKAQKVLDKMDFLKEAYGMNREKLLKECIELHAKYADRNNNNIPAEYDWENKKRNTFLKVLYSTFNWNKDHINDEINKLKTNSNKEINFEKVENFKLFLENDLKPQDVNSYNYHYGNMIKSHNELVELINISQKKNKNENSELDKNIKEKWEEYIKLIGNVNFFQHACKLSTEEILQFLVEHDNDENPSMHVIEQTEAYIMALKIKLLVPLEHHKLINGLQNVIISCNEGKDLSDKDEKKILNNVLLKCGIAMPEDTIFVNGLQETFNDYCNELKQALPKNNITTDNFIPPYKGSYYNYDDDHMPNNQFKQNFSNNYTNLLKQTRMRVKIDNVIDKMLSVKEETIENFITSKIQSTSSSDIFNCPQQLQGTNNDKVIFHPCNCGTECSGSAKGFLNICTTRKKVNYYDNLVEEILYKENGKSSITQDQLKKNFISYMLTMYLLGEFLYTKIGISKNTDKPSTINEANGLYQGCLKIVKTIQEKLKNVDLGKFMLKNKSFPRAFTNFTKYFAVDEKNRQFKLKKSITKKFADKKNKTFSKTYSNNIYPNRSNSILSNNYPNMNNNIGPTLLGYSQSY